MSKFYEEDDPEVNTERFSIDHDDRLLITNSSVTYI